MIKEAPQFPGEKCHYSIACEDPDSTTGNGMRRSRSKCVKCKGEREHARANGCYASYLASTSDGDQIIRRIGDFIEGGEGFVLASEYFTYRKEQQKIAKEKQKVASLEKELKDLESLPKEFAGPGAQPRIEELRRKLGR